MRSPKQSVKTLKKIQLVRNLPRGKTYPDGLEIRNLVKWLTTIDFS